MYKIQRNRCYKDRTTKTYPFRKETDLLCYRLVIFAQNIPMPVRLYSQAVIFICPVVP